MHESTGYLTFDHGAQSFQTWYRLVGDLKSDKRPVVVLHGGPAIPSQYMDPFTTLHTDYGLPVIFYDQVGGGKSTHLPDAPAEFWSMDLFMDELDAVLGHFGIASDFDLCGHSWGGMLSSYYVASRQPKGLHKLVLSDTPASMTLWETCANNLLDRLPKDMKEMLRRHEREGTTDSEEYQTGMLVYYKKFMCKVDPWPETLSDAFAKMEEEPSVYKKMVGSSEFSITGTLKTWTVIDKLHLILAPTLLLNSVDDEAQDECVLPLFQKIPNVRWAQFANSSHMPFYEEKDRYFKIVGDFIVNE